MAKNMRDRVRESFKPDDKDSLKYYLDSLKASWEDYADGIRRSAILMVLLMILFELLLKGSVKQVTIGSFVLSNATTILAFIPTGVAYFYYEALDNVIGFEDIADSYGETFAVWNKTAKENELNLFMQPRVPAFFPAGSAPGLGPEKRMMDIVTQTIAYLALLGPLGFDGYAFYQLFGVLHASSVLLWTNVALSILLLGMALLRGLMWASLRAETDRLGISNRHELRLFPAESLVLSAFTQLAAWAAGPMII